MASDQLTGVAVTLANDRFVTVDTSGRIKMHNIGDMDFRTGTKEEIDSKIGNPWFVNAHRREINSVEIVEQKNEEDIESSESGEEIELPEGLEKEERQPWPDIFILTAGADYDILLHRLSTGVRIGQFGQEDYWNIFDMTPYDKVRPRYVREWLKLKKEKWLGLINARIDEMRAQGRLMEEESKIPEVRLSTKDQLSALGINVKMSDGNSLFGSDDLNPLETDGYDQFDINLDHLESDDDEDMKIQD